MFRQPLCGNESARIGISLARDCRIGQVRKRRELSHAFDVTPTRALRAVPRHAPHPIFLEPSLFVNCIEQCACHVTSGSCGYAVCQRFRRCLDSLVFAAAHRSKLMTMLRALSGASCWVQSILQNARVSWHDRAECSIAERRDSVLVCLHVCKAPVACSRRRTIDLLLPTQCQLMSAQPVSGFLTTIT